MDIRVIIKPIAKVEELMKELLMEEFQVKEEIAQELFKNQIKKHFDNLKDSCYLVAETNYVDKVYRNSYYHYYSSKLNKTKRECVRISIFDGIVKKEEDFQNKDKVEVLKKCYRGFIILRPTIPYVIGRSTLSPLVLNENKFLCCTAPLQTTVNNIKMSVIGFPHSSQDTETMTCAETTLWAIMEYFGTKYPEYRPTLPFRIIETLNNISFERQIPSQGLHISQMSFVLKEFGFGTRIYSLEHDENFENHLSCYVESGIPIIIDIDNRHKVGTSVPEREREKEIGHANICIGHEKISNGHISGLPICIETILIGEKEKKIEFFDWDDIKKEFIFIDDNCPTYQKARLDEPTKHYPKEWRNCKIHSFVVPLYTKVYLGVDVAKSYIKLFLATYNVIKNGETLIRFYLTSSRSFKDSLSLNPSFHKKIKEIILEKMMPKFIYVAELSNKELMKNSPREAEGLIILDATEANIENDKPLIIGLYGDRYFKYDLANGCLKENQLHYICNQFTIYENNLI